MIEDDSLLPIDECQSKNISSSVTISSVAKGAGIPIILPIEAGRKTCASWAAKREAGEGNPTPCITSLPLDAGTYAGSQSSSSKA